MAVCQESFISIEEDSKPIFEGLIFFGNKADRFFYLIMVNADNGNKNLIFQIFRGKLIDKLLSELDRHSVSIRPLFKLESSKF